MPTEEDKEKAAALNRKAAALEETGNHDKAAELRFQATGLLAEDPDAMPPEPTAHPNPPEKVAKSPEKAQPKPQVRRADKSAF